MKSSAYILAAALAIPSMAVMASESSCSYSEMSSLPISYWNNSATPVLEGEVNDRRVHMLIETAANRTFLLKAEADRQQLPLARVRGKMLSSGGSADMYTARVKRLALGAGHLDNLDLAVVESNEKAAFGAVVGADFLMQEDMDLALRDKHVKFFHAQGCQDKALAYWDSKALDIPMEPISPRDLRQTFTVEINGQKMRAMINTASARSTINLAAAARVGMTPQSPGVTPGRALGKGAEQHDSWYGEFDSFAIGSETVSHPHFYFTDMYPTQRFGRVSMPDVVLGRDFLNAHHVLLAVSQNRLYYSYLGGPVFEATQPQ